MRVAPILFTAVLSTACGSGFRVPPEPTGPVEVAVSFQSGSVTLCGSLRLPSAGARGVPGVVLVHGSGVQDRDESVPATLMLDRETDALDGRLDAVLFFRPSVLVFREIAEELSRRGYAVLRYDKRDWLAVHGSACGPTPVIDPFAATAHDSLADSLSAVAFLKGRAEVDPSRVFVAGHSEGSAYALLQATLPGQVRGAISIAGPARRLDVMHTGQTGAVLDYVRSLPEGAASESDIRQAQEQDAQTRDLYARLRGGTYGAQETFAGVGGQYWLSLLQVFDATEATVRAAEAPLLFVGGDADYNVPATDLAIFAGWVGPRDTVRMLPGLTHALTPVADGPSGRVSPLLLGVLAEWLDAQSSS